MTAVYAETSEHRFVSYVLHKLSQPLTALHCALELSLTCDRTSAEFRVSVEAALENAQRLRQGLQLLHELNNADEPGDTSAPVPLADLLADLREELSPLLESAGKILELSLRPVHVWGNRMKLARGFFYVLLFLFRYTARGLRLTICPSDREPTGWVEIAITATEPPVSSEAMPNALEGEPDCEMEIGRRSFQAVGGNLKRTASSAAEMAWRIQLPIAR